MTPPVFKVDPSVFETGNASVLESMTPPVFKVDTSVFETGNASVLESMTPPVFKGKLASSKHFSLYELNKASDALIINPLGHDIVNEIFVEFVYVSFNFNGQSFSEGHTINVPILITIIKLFIIFLFQFLFNYIYFS